jgi:hypothetical protein
LRRRRTSAQDGLYRDALQSQVEEFFSLSQPDLADVQQVVAYAVELGVSRAALIYPANTMETSNVFVGHVNVQCMSFDIGGDIERAGYEFLEKLGLAESLEQRSPTRS